MLSISQCFLQWKRKKKLAQTLNRWTKLCEWFFCLFIYLIILVLALLIPHFNAIELICLTWYSLLHRTHTHFFFLFWRLTNECHMYVMGLYVFRSLFLSLLLGLCRLLTYSSITLGIVNVFVVQLVWKSSGGGDNSKSITMHVKSMLNQMKRLHHRWIRINRIAKFNSEQIAYDFIACPSKL